MAVIGPVLALGRRRLPTGFGHEPNRPGARPTKALDGAGSPWPSGRPVEFSTESTALGSLIGSVQGSPLGCGGLSGRPSGAGPRARRSSRSRPTLAAALLLCGAAFRLRRASARPPGVGHPQASRSRIPLFFSSLRLCGGFFWLRLCRSVLLHPGFFAPCENSPCLVGLPTLCQGVGGGSTQSDNQKTTGSAGQRRPGDLRVFPAQGLSSEASPKNMAPATAKTKTP
jgi:hypothetical protein